MLNTEQDYDVTIPFRHPVEFARILVCKNSLWIFSQNCEWQAVLCSVHLPPSWSQSCTTKMS